MLRHRLPLLLVLVSLTALIIGCSDNSPLVPSPDPGGERAFTQSVRSGGHSLWGQWELVVDLENSEIHAVPIRTADLHFNVVTLMMEGTPQSALGFSNLLVDASSHTLQVDISLTHPFPTLPQVAGFDVRGILFTRGSGFTLNSSANAIMTADYEPRLSNADGYTRWWNPEEFLVTGLLGYTDGQYGTAYNVGGYDITLAGYKYFADSIGALDSLADLVTADRGVFRAGSTNTRRYLIDFGSESGTYLIFNYAVDACWDKIPGFTPGGPPPVVPGDFPLTANSPEPYRIRVTESMNNMTGTTAGGTSGTVNLNIDVFDWQAMDPLTTVPMEISVVQCEIPAFGLGPVDAAPVAGSGAGGHMSTYTCSLSGAGPEKYETIDVVVSATCWEGDYQKDITGFITDAPLQALFVHEASVIDGDTYSGWTHRYTKLLYPEQPNQGDNLPDIAVYELSGGLRAATVDQANPDPNGDGDHMPDSINEWANDYETWSLPEHYHMPLDPLIGTGLWDDVRGITVSDATTRLFFSTTNTTDEFSDGETEPLYSYFSWITHTYLGNDQAEAYNSIFFSEGAYPRYWATDPSNGLSLAPTQDFIYTVFLYDTTGMSGPNPGADPERYIIARWKQPYTSTTTDVKWQRPTNTYPDGTGPGYIDYADPFYHRLAVDDSLALDRFYMRDSENEIEVVDCDFTQNEFNGYFPIGTVTIPNWPADVTSIIDIEVVNTTALGTPRNHVAALCEAGSEQWMIWVFDYDSSQPVDSQAITQWTSDIFEGIPASLDAADDPIELHVLHKNGGLINVSVFRDYP